MSGQCLFVSVEKNISDFDKKLDFSALCRVCMSSDKKMKCMFSGETTKIVEEFEFCTGIKLHKSDGLPSNMCDFCFMTLAVSHKFKTTSLRSNDVLRKLVEKQMMLKNVDDIKIEETIEVENGGFEYEFEDFKVKDEIVSDEEYVPDELNGAENEPPSTNPRTKTKTINIKRNKTKNNLHLAKSKTSKNKGKLKKIKLKKQIDPEVVRLRNCYCQVCNITFDSPKERAEHRKKQHAETIWICEFCGKSFKYRSSHYSHVLTHLPPKYPCEHCEYRTWHRADLNKHLSIHKQIKKYVCEFCTKAFHTTSNMRDHIRRNHEPVRTRSFVCPRCGRGFYANDKLKRHLDSHDNIKRFVCTVCDARFARRCRWKTHMQTMHDICVPRVTPGRKRNELVKQDTPNKTNDD